MTVLLSDCESEVDERGRARYYCHIHLPDGPTVESRIRALLIQNEALLDIPKKPEQIVFLESVSTPTGQVFRFNAETFELKNASGMILVELDRDEVIRKISVGFQLHKPLYDFATHEMLGIGGPDPLAAARDALYPAELSPDPKMTKIVLQGRGGKTIYAYEVVVHAENPFGDWRIIVDENTGAIIDKTLLTDFCPDFDSKVFFPDPISTSGDRTLRSPDKTKDIGVSSQEMWRRLEDQKRPCTLVGLTEKDGFFAFDGPYVSIVDQVLRPSAPEDFDPPLQSKGFEEIMIYYHIDAFQRYIRSRPVDIPNACSWPIKIVAHYAKTNQPNAAWFSPTERTIYFKERTDPGENQHAEDAKVVLHEYAHAVLDDQTRFPSRYEKGEEYASLTQGFALFLPCAYFAPFVKLGEDVMGEWIAPEFQDSIRVNVQMRDPHSKQDAKDPKKFDEYADWTHVFYDTQIVGMNKNALIERGAVLWSSALWRVFVALGGVTADPDQQRQEEARIRARDETIRVLLASDFSLTQISTIREAAEELMRKDAELPEFRGRHLGVMLKHLQEVGILKPSPNRLVIRNPGFAQRWDAEPQPKLISISKQPDIWMELTDSSSALWLNLFNEGEATVDSGIASAILKAPSTAGGPTGESMSSAAPFFSIKPKEARKVRVALSGPLRRDMIPGAEIEISIGTDPSQTRAYSVRVPASD